MISENKNFNKPFFHITMMILPRIIIIYFYISLIDIFISTMIRCLSLAWIKRHCRFYEYLLLLNIIASTTSFYYMNIDGYLFPLIWYM